MPVGVVRNILDSLDREVLNQLDLTKSIEHPGESGRAREQIVAAYLRRVVPADFGISTGFVFDAKGGISRQMDVIIYRTGYHPVLEIGGIRHFMVESVVAVLENKASITSTQALRNAFENIRSVKILDRTNGGKNYLLGGLLTRQPVNADEFQHQVFGAIVTEQSLSQDSLKQEWMSFLQAYPNRREWPNFYADLRHFSGMYLKEVEPPRATAVPEEAVCLALTDPAVENRVAPLLELTFELVNFIRVAVLIDFSPTDYLLSEGGRFHWWKLP